MQFQSASGIDVVSILKLVEYYLGSAVTMVQEKLFLQKKKKSGIFIGSRIAPLLSEVYIRVIGIMVSQSLAAYAEGSVIVRRYLDDILVCSLDPLVGKRVKESFLKAAPEVTFSVENVQGGWLQFLGIRFLVENDLCWEFGKTDSKPLFSRLSCYSKIIKRGVLKSVLVNSIKVSCIHRLGVGLEKQICRLSSAKYSRDFASSVIYRWLTSSNGSRNTTVEKGNVKGLPYFHNVPHNLKALAAKFCVRVMFKPDFRLDRLAPSSLQEIACSKYHRDCSVGCDLGVVYQIPVKCGACYVGQTARCINDRLTGRKRAVKNKADSSELAKHLSSCNKCVVVWKNTRVLNEEKDLYKRLAKESLMIDKHKNCFSNMSVSLGSHIRTFLNQ